MLTCPVTGVKIGQIAEHPVLGYGFRPFFVLAGVYGALSIALWLMMWSGVFKFSSALAPSYFHAHEMIFGFAGAALGGFLLTAVPNWTDLGPVRGWALLVLVLAWIAGRAAMLLSGVLDPGMVAAADLLFFPLLAVFQVLAIVVRSARRNSVFIVILVALFVANLGVHLEALGVSETATWGSRLGLNIFVLAITLVGGRIVPAFTQSGLKAQGIPTTIHQAPRLDAAAILFVAAMAVADAAHAPGAAVGSLAGLAALANLARLMRWCGHLTLRWPLLWVLHLGMAWLVVGLALKAASGFGLVPEVAALHALGAGAIGTMILAVMTRATLGHTGRDLVAIPGSAIAYLAIGTAAVLRITTAFLPGMALEFTAVAGVFWAAGFAGFLILYGPILLTSRPDGRAG